MSTYMPRKSWPALKLRSLISVTIVNRSEVYVMHHPDVQPTHFLYMLYNHHKNITRLHLQAAILDNSETFKLTFIVTPQSLSFTVSLIIRPLVVGSSCQYFHALFVDIYIFPN